MELIFQIAFGVLLGFLLIKFFENYFLQFISIFVLLIGLFFIIIIFIICYFLLKDVQTSSLLYGLFTVVIFLFLYYLLLTIISLLTKDNTDGSNDYSILLNDKNNKKIKSKYEIKNGKLIRKNKL
jgi:hypothetical protein